MFTFNFDIDKKDLKNEPIENVKSNDSNDLNKGKQIEENKSSILKWIPPKCYNPSLKDAEFVEKCSNTLAYEINDVKISYVNPSSIEELLSKLNDNDIQVAIDEHNDLKPSIYEGGFSVWECTWDLVDHLALSQISFDGAHVLELGCGAALPAIYTAIKGAHITLQDYNEEVIKWMSLPNALLNLTNCNPTEKLDNQQLLSQVKSKVNFFCGDWENFDCLLEKSLDYGKFDLILSCEAIYNPESHKKLLNVLTSSLKDDGTIVNSFYRVCLANFYTDVEIPTMSLSYSLLALDNNLNAYISTIVSKFKFI